MAPRMLFGAVKMEVDNVFEPKDASNEPLGAQSAPSRSLRSKDRIDYTAQLAPTTGPLKKPSRPSRILNSGARMRAAAKMPTSATQATPMPQNASKPCKFLDDLPAELRNRIYELVFGNSTIHIYINPVDFQLDSILGFSRFDYNVEPIFRAFCVAEDEEDAHIQKIQTQDPAEALDEDHEERHQSCRNRGSATNAFALLQTCRQIHSEAALIPFISNTFSFTELMTLDRFLRGLIPTQARAIQHIAYTANSYSNFMNLPATRDWKELLGGKLESLTCVAEFVGDRDDSFDYYGGDGEDYSDAILAFRDLEIKDVKVVACNVYEDDDDEVVPAEELRAFAKEVEDKLKNGPEEEQNLLKLVPIPKKEEED